RSGELSAARRSQRATCISQSARRTTFCLARRLLSGEPSDNLSGDLAATHCSFLYTAAADDRHSKTTSAPGPGRADRLRQVGRPAVLRRSALRVDGPGVVAPGVAGPPGTARGGPVEHLLGPARGAAARPEVLLRHRFFGPGDADGCDQPPVAPGPPASADRGRRRHFRVVD